MNQSDEAKRKRLRDALILADLGNLANNPDQNMESWERTHERLLRQSAKSPQSESEHG